MKFNTFALVMCLIIASIIGAQAESRWDVTGGTDFGGPAPSSYYFNGDYQNAMARVQTYEILGASYGPDETHPSPNADGVSFTGNWTAGSTMDVTWVLNQAHVMGTYDYPDAQYFNLWADLNENGKWDTGEIVFSDLRHFGDTGWTSNSVGLKTFTGSFIMPGAVGASWSGWLHATLSYAEDVTASSSYQHVEWNFGESEDYYGTTSPELSSGTLLLVGMLPVGLGWWRRRRTA